MEQTFDSLASLIAYVFRQLQTPLLSVDKIFDFINSNGFQVQIEKNGVVPSSTISKRTIINELSRCDIFVSSNSLGSPGLPPPPPPPPHHHNTVGPSSLSSLSSLSTERSTHQQKGLLWALRPNNPLFQCDAAIATSIEQMLTEHGPLTVNELVNLTEQMGADENLFNRVLSVHSDEFMSQADGRIWFALQPLPIRCDFENVEQAINFALNVFTAGATVEELRRFLCLSTHNGIPITRICISHTFIQRPDLFVQIQRGKYAQVDSEIAIESGNANMRSSSAHSLPRPSLIPLTEDETAFNPDDFFGGGFAFSPE